MELQFKTGTHYLPFTEEIPLGPGVPSELPHTGQAVNEWMILLGICVTVLGILIRKK